MQGPAASCRVCRAIVVGRLVAEAMYLALSEPGDWRLGLLTLRVALEVSLRPAPTNVGVPVSTSRRTRKIFLDGVIFDTSRQASPSRGRSAMASQEKLRIPATLKLPLLTAETPRRMILPMRRDDQTWSPSPDLISDAEGPPERVWRAIQQ
jgi:hypothetical protein